MPREARHRRASKPALLENVPAPFVSVAPLLRVHPFPPPPPLLLLRFLRYLAIRLRAAARISAASPIRPPPCARSGFPPPRPPNCASSSFSTLAASTGTLGDRATTTAGGEDADNSTTALPGSEAIAEAMAFRPAASHPSSRSTMTRPAAVSDAPAISRAAS